MLRSCVSLLVVTLCLSVAGRGARGQIQGDTSLLQRVSDEYRRNLSAIRTWQGRVRIEHSRTAGESVDESGIMTEFALDAARRNLVYQSVTSRSVDGALRESLVCGMSTPDAYYRSTPHQQDVRNTVTIHPPGEERHGFLSPDFDPLLFLSVHSIPVDKRLLFFLDNASDIHLKDVVVSQSGPVVTVESVSSNTRWTYRFDLNQGGNPVDVEGTDMTGTSEHWTCRFAHVSGAWVPAEVEFHRSTPDKITRRRFVWETNEVNAPLGPDTFAVAALGVVPGDAIHDLRSGMEYLYEQDEFVRKIRAPAVATPLERKTRGAWLLAANALCAAIVLFIVIRRRRRAVEATLAK